jgi:putative hemolysin
MLEIGIILILTLLNGVFAMSELAVVSSRRARLQSMVDHGVRGARGAMRLIDNPSRFLSTVQIGITMVSVIAGAYGGATLGERFGGWLDTVPAMSGHGRTIGVASVIVVITFLSIVIGELIPKRIALLAPERIALYVGFRRLGIISGLWQGSGQSVYCLMALKPDGEISGIMVL